MITEHVVLTRFYMSYFLKHLKEEEEIIESLHFLQARLVKVFQPPLLYLYDADLAFAVACEDACKFLALAVFFLEYYRSPESRPFAINGLSAAVATTLPSFPVAKEEEISSFYLEHFRRAGAANFTLETVEPADFFVAMERGMVDGFYERLGLSRLTTFGMGSLIMEQHLKPWVEGGHNPLPLPVKELESFLSTYYTLYCTLKNLREVCAQQTQLEIWERVFQKLPFPQESNFMPHLPTILKEVEEQVHFLRAVRDYVQAGQPASQFKALKEKLPIPVNFSFKRPINIGDNSTIPANLLE